MPTQDEKNRMAFWILKRHTSYTAWQRAYEAFCRMMDALKEVNAEVARVPEGTYGMPGVFWESWIGWDELNRMQLYFKTMCERRSSGDAKVLSYCGASCTRDYTFLRWLQILTDVYDSITGHIKGDYAIEPYPFPKREWILPIITNATKLYIENITIPDLKAYYCIPLNISSFYFSPLYQADSQKQNFNSVLLYPLPPNLPPLPEPVIFEGKPSPWWAFAKHLSGPLAVQSGAKFPKTGIFQSNVDQGLCYGIAGTAARKILPMGIIPYGPDDYVECTWTLIWEDNRYQNGAPIPEEEHLYFPDKE